MRTLVFNNPAHLYPVNRYQSLVLAHLACQEAVQVAASAGKPMAALSAVEICCGGSPAALAMKASGVGFVGASDIQGVSLQQTRLNASINGMSLDRVALGSGLEPWINTGPWLDLVACNPPCLPDALVDSRLGTAWQTAMKGGSGGFDLLFEILGALDKVLLPHGRFVFVVTSMMDFERIAQFLHRHVEQAWRVCPGTPVAAPYCRLDEAVVPRLVAMRDERHIFVWQGEDGWLWRLTWGVAVGASAAAMVSDRPAFGFYPYGFMPTAPDYLHALEIFGQAIPDNPLPKVAPR
jgi:hypothetical protein